MCPSSCIRDHQSGASPPQDAKDNAFTTTRRRKKLKRTSINRKMFRVDLRFLSGNSSQSELQIQCDTYQNPSWIFFFLTEIGKPILNFIRKREEPRIAKTIFKKNKAGGPSLSYFKTYYKATVIEAV